MAKYNIYTTIVTKYQVEANSAEEAKRIFYSMEDPTKILVYSKRADERIELALPVNRISAYLGK